MLKLSRGGKFLTGVVFVFCLLSACFGDEERLVSSELLKAGGLKIVWENKMPIGKKESLEELLILGNRLYGFSSRNYLVSLDRSNGIEIFSRPFGQAGSPILGFRRLMSL